MKPSLFIMQQDSLHHVSVSVSLPEEEVTPEALLTEGEEVVSVQTVAVRREMPDTVRCAPSELRPLPGDLPLEGVPTPLKDDYWAFGLLRVERSEVLVKLDSLYGTHTECGTLNTTGMAGDPVPYRFRTDNFVTICLLVSFFLVVWVISRSRHYLRLRVKDFFHRRVRDNLFAERAETELRGQIFLIFQTCFVLAVLFFDVTRKMQVEVFNQVSPYMILGMDTAVCLVYFTTKIGLYSFVNSVFFDTARCRRFTEAYLLCILALGVALFPPALLMVYFDLNFQTLMWVVICLIAVDKLLLLYKIWSIFFSTPIGWVHLFMYFCTLEIAPLLVLYRAMLYANNFLLTIN